MGLVSLLMPQIWIYIPGFKIHVTGLVGLP